MTSSSSELHLALHQEQFVQYDWNNPECPENEEILLQNVPVRDGDISTLLIDYKCPNDWDQNFPHQTYNETKKKQIEHGFRNITEDDDRELVLCTNTSLPVQLTPADHPLEQTEWGPYFVTTRWLKDKMRSPWDITDSADVPDKGTSLDTTLSFFRFKEDQKYSGSMKRRENDIFGKPKINPSQITHSWELSKGRYIILRAKVTEQHGLEYTDYKQYEIEEGRSLNEWMMTHRLVDRIWVELTLGSVRCMTFLYWEAIIWRTRHLKLLCAWNGFYNLWTLFNWAQYIGPGGQCPTTIELDIDWFLLPQTLPLYSRMIRNLSVKDAHLEDERDRPLIEEKIVYYWKGDPETEMKFISPPQGKKWPPSSMKSPWQVDKTTHIVHDFSYFERFVRVTAIAVFAKHCALTRCTDQQSYEYWYLCWEELAERFQYEELKNAMKKCRPGVWYQEMNAVEDPTAFRRRVKEWFHVHVVSAIEIEKRRTLNLAVDCPLRPMTSSSTYAQTLQNFQTMEKTLTPLTA